MASKDLVLNWRKREREKSFFAELDKNSRKVERWIQFQQPNGANR